MASQAGKRFSKIGLTQERLREYWLDRQRSEKLRHLIEVWVSDGVDFALRDARLWHAVDLAFDAPLQQITPTIFRDILESAKSDREILDKLQVWGINVRDVIVQVMDESGQRKPAVNLPAFFHIVVPLVRAYVTIRRARLFNERNLYPLFSYQPATMTAKERALCQVVTDIVRRVSEDYGYSAVLKQLILQTLLYGTALMFVREEWHRETRPGPDGKPEHVKAGLRYEIPHPTRVFWDLAHPLYSLNTDTGCRFAGYWRLDRWGEIKRQSGYWLDQPVPYTRRNWPDAYPAVFKELYPCHMRWPIRHASPGGSREQALEEASYGTDDENAAVMVTELFAKLVPSEYGISEYDEPVWFRMVIASDDTVIYCAPVAYCPIIYCGYDADASRATQSSLALETVWAQDHFANLMSQLIWSVQQNLSRIVWYDTSQVSQSDIERLLASGRRRYSSLVLIPYDSRRAAHAQHQKAEAFIPVSFQPLNTFEIVNAMNQILNVLERALVLSSHEIAQPATHEQTAEETRTIAAATSTRVAFTGSFIDEAIDAWKRQLFEAVRAYMDEDVSAYIEQSTPEVTQALLQLGFKLTKEVEGAPNTQPLYRVVGPADLIELSAFASVREGESRINLGAVATSIATVLQAALANPLTAQAIGAEQALEIMSLVVRMSGGPRDFRLRPTGATPQEQAENARQQIMQVAEQLRGAVLRDVEQSFARPLAEQLVQMANALAQIKSQVDQQQQILQAVSGAALPAPAEVAPSLISVTQPAPAPAEVAPSQIGTAQTASAPTEAAAGPAGATGV